MQWRTAFQRQTRAVKTGAIEGASVVIARAGVRLVLLIRGDIV